jgi:hypothetical protein
MIRTCPEAFKSNTAHAMFAHDAARELARTNDRFDRSRFVMACMPRHHIGTRHANVWERTASNVNAFPLSAR